MAKSSNNDFKENFSERYRITDGSQFKLAECSTAPAFKIDNGEAKEALEEIVEEISELQNILYADNKWSLLLVFQAMDAAGKDSTIKNILTGVNPQGVDVFSFKSPSTLELDHTYLWRTDCRAPERGKIGVFNRSYYEETLVVRVHPEILAKQHLNKSLITENIWQERFEDIRNREKHMSRNGTVVLKFFLNISREEQKQRFLERIDRPQKNWKFEKADIHERQFWDDYMMAYEETIQNTATEYAPWYVIPGDSKPFARLMVADAVHQALKNLNLEYPQLHPDALDYLAQCREILMNEEEYLSKKSQDKAEEQAGKDKEGKDKGNKDKKSKD